MRLSWNEIRVRAATFAKEWKSEGYEKGQTQLFYRDFFEVFGVPVRRVATFEEPVKKLGGSRGFVDLFWKGVLLVEQKSAGRNLEKAKTQALDYFPGLRDSELPRYVLLSDFRSFELYDLDENNSLKFDLPDLPKYVESFGFIIGVRKREFRDQDPANIKASELVGRLHDALEESGYTGMDLERFLVRLVFCLFADDTGIFEPRDIFLDFIENRTSEDGTDIGAKLVQLFQILDTPIPKRSEALDEDLGQFPYVNGDLFKESIRIPSFDAEMRRQLIEASRFDWSDISPAIFGALFQSVMEPRERREQGAHYTTEKNILKVIEPLFLDDLKTEFERIRKRRDTRRHVELQKFHEKISELKFLDPACGCGNFLIITYRELRLLEIEVLREIRTHRDDHRTRELDISSLCKVDVHQFYGVEISEFPARIAETALWMMDHFMNNMLSLEFGQSFTRIPLTTAPHISCSDALETDWNELVPAEDCSYVLGNPPFIGAKYQSTAQRSQVRDIASLGGGGGTLDYVGAWFLKAGEYVRGRSIGIGFVATNSISQGEQVAQLWPLLFGRYGLAIIFGHRTFEWGSDARGKAHVHVVIIGLMNEGFAPADRRLFSYETLKSEPYETIHRALTPYLFDGGNLSNSNVVVYETSTSLNGFPRLRTGSKPIDGGNYIFSSEEREIFLAEEVGAEPFIRPFIGSKEFLQGGERYILWLGDAEPGELEALPKVKERIRAVKSYRLASKSKPTQKLAEFPTKFHINVVPDAPYLVVPEVSSERREYIPIAWLEPPAIPSNLVRVVLDADKKLFAILSSTMHMSWVRHIGGRLKSDYRYSIGLVYNPYPVPQITESDNKQLEKLADAVLNARVNHRGSSLSSMYDPDLMPPDLRRAHQALDSVVDGLYRKGGFSSDRDRVEHLFSMYEKMITPELI